MVKTHTCVEIGSAEKYLNRLCKHFKHKVDAEFGEGKGEVDFKFARCQMLADINELKISCQAEDEDNLARVKYVIEDHLTRFAWKEEKEVTIKWE